MFSSGVCEIENVQNLLQSSSVESVMSEDITSIVRPQRALFCLLTSKVIR